MERAESVVWHSEIDSVPTLKQVNQKRGKEQLAAFLKKALDHMKGDIHDFTNPVDCNRYTQRCPDNGGRQASIETQEVNEAIQRKKPRRLDTAQWNSDVPRRG